jgi:heparosan-N-sulfate-glucuronate 5-epimerase
LKTMTALQQALVEAKAGYNALMGRSVAFQHQPLGRHIEPAGVAGYYCDLRHKAQDAARFADGMPRDPLGRLLAWPIPVAQVALGHWELALEGHDTHDRFLALADWLLDHAVPASGGLAWPCQVAVPKYGLSPGWHSALAQSETISVLLRAHLLSGQDRYLQMAHAALAPLLVPIDHGGVLRSLDGQPVLEEYPTERPAAVLNGWIVGLFGVHELANVTGDERARTLFDASLSGLLALLPRYDVGWWSRYSLLDHGRPDLAKPFYQRLHAVLLDALSLVRPDARLGETARRWEAQITRIALLRISANKIRFRIHRAIDDARR